MGVPIGRIVCATNANDIVHRTLSAGDMRFGANVATLSPAMDIQFAYNLERVLFYACNEDPGEVRRYMGDLEKHGGARLDALLLRRLRETFDSMAVTDEQTLATMRGMHARHGYFLCPHSAIAVHAAERLKLPPGPRVCVLTAHPCKFEDAVTRATGLPPPFPPAVLRMKTLPHRFRWLRADGKRSIGKAQAWAATLRAAVEAISAARRESGKACRDASADRTTCTPSKL